MPRDDHAHQLPALADPDAFVVAGVPLSLITAVYDHRQAQGRRVWPSPDTAGVPEAPWANVEDPTLQYLLRRAEHDAPRDLRPALFRLALAAWAEGHVEGYGRAVRELCTEAGTA